MANKQETKRRIKSVESTKKITNAMQLVATSKLKKVKTQMDKTKVYSEMIYQTVSDILSHNQDLESEYLVHNPVDKNLYILITSSLGLCGGYNSNVIKLAKEIIKDNDQVIIVGSKGINASKHHQWDVISEYPEIGVNSSYIEIMEIMKKATKAYTDGHVKAIHLLYTKYVNPVSFEPTKLQLLPIETQDKVNQGSYKYMIFEPSPSVVLDQIIPLYLNSVFYGRMIESLTSEQASRRNAMENATNNAEELKDQLLLEYNRARQASITQEISEIVAGANAQ